MFLTSTLRGPHKRQHQQKKSTCQLNSKQPVKTNQELPPLIGRICGIKDCNLCLRWTTPTTHQFAVLCVNHTL